MIAAPIPQDEARRLAALHKLNILDTPPEDRFDRITRIAAKVLKVPAVVLSLIDSDRQWFKSQVGLGGKQTPREEAFCAHTIVNEGPLEVYDAQDDLRFHDNPSVIGAPFIRFYFGQPLAAVDGSKVGSLCVVDQVPRHFTEEEQAILADLARLAEAELNAGSLAEVLDRLTESEKRYHDLFERAQACVLTLKCDGTILDANPSWKRLFGYHTDELTDLNFLQLATEESRPDCEDFFRQLNKGKDIDNFEGWFVTSDGHQVYLTGSAVCYADEEEGATVHAILRDHSARQKAEESLHQAAEIAKSAVELKAGMLAKLSHEVRTPLNGILGVTGMLLETQLEGEQRRLAETVHQSAEGMKVLLDRVLDFSKAESGLMETECIGFNPLSLLKTTAALYEPAGLAKGVKVVVEADNELPAEVQGDPHRLAQVLNNLVGNAVKFTKRGYIRLRAHTSGEKDSLKLHIAVADDGVGIPKEALEHIFDRFTQADRSVERQFGGTGLGLAIARQIVDLLGGRLGVESAVGIGSKFSFSVPVKPAASKPVAAVTQPDPAAPEPSKRLKVLVVDDSKINLMVAIHALKKLNCEVIEAEDGVDAVNLWRKEQPDIVFLDCEMPRMNGYEATREIRRLGEDSVQTPIIAMTAHVLEAERVRCFDSGMDDYITKPFTPADLRRLIGMWTSEEGITPVISSEFEIFRNEAYEYGGEKLFQKLVTAFQEDARDSLETLEASDSPVSAIRNAAHKLKGSAANFGARRIANLAGQVEIEARDEEHPASIVAVAQLRREVTRLVGYLRNEAAKTETV